GRAGERRQGERLSERVKQGFGDPFPSFSYHSLLAGPGTMRLSNWRQSSLAVLALCVLVVVSGCKPKTQNGGGGGSSSDVPEFTFITNGPADFWNHSEAGCRKAEKDFGVKVTFQRPTGLTDQIRMLEDL